MKAKILIIEDVPELAELVSIYLEKDGLETRIVESAEKALETLKNYAPDLLILDLCLPGMNGFEFLKKFRSVNQSVPVIITSAKNEEEAIIEGMDIGADEFVTKPFSPRVLVAKVNAKIRRNSEICAASENCKTFGPYKFLLNSDTLKKNGEKVPLSAKESKLLEFLIKNEGHPLPPKTILGELWPETIGDVTMVAVYIQRLRKKIEENPSHPAFIQNEFGKGYIFRTN